MNRFIHLQLSTCVIIAAWLANGCTSAHGKYPEPDVRIENLKQTVHYLSAMRPARNADNMESLHKAERYIRNKLHEYGLEPQRQEFEVRGRNYANITAFAGPAKGSRMVVGAHYDVYGELPGADDNASAVAGLLEIARFAKQHESELPLGIEFVAYTLEEPPFFRTPNMGSHVHAESLSKADIAVRGMICLEMIGYFTDKKGSQDYPIGLMKLFYPDTGNFIAVVGNFSSSALVGHVARHLKTTAVPVETLRSPSFVTGVDFSDHRNYWKFGYDAVMVTDTAFYRNPNYHKRTDTIDTLDFRKMAEVVKGVCLAILNMPPASAPTESTGRSRPR